MILLSVAALVAVVGAIAALIIMGWQDARRAAAFNAERVAWTAERRELLNRIQAPQHLPVAPVENFVWEQDDHSDEIGLVGAILEPKADE